MIGFGGINFTTVIQPEGSVKNLSDAPYNWQGVANEESYSEGLAIHTDPESCGYVGNDMSEALTGAHAGWVLSRESLIFGVPTLSKMSEGNTGCQPRKAR